MSNFFKGLKLNVFHTGPHAAFVSWFIILINGLTPECFFSSHFVYLKIIVSYLVSPCSASLALVVATSLQIISPFSTHITSWLMTVMPIQIYCRQSFIHNKYSTAVLYTRYSINKFPFSQITLGIGIYIFMFMYIHTCWFDPLMSNCP